MDSPSITDLSLAQLYSLVPVLGIKRYTVDQIVRWLYKKKVATFEEMTNLSLAARKLLAENYIIDHPKLSQILKAADGTRKFVFTLKDDAKIESVLIPTDKKRLTLCVSTQVGCPMGCAFCRTAGMGFRRDLTQGEILGQLIEVQKICEQEGLTLTNVVFMGMGEPLVNYDAVSSAIEIILLERAFNFSKRRITVSTSVLLPQLEKFSKMFGVKLAISLNATTDKVRSELMPLNKRYSISSLFKFARAYTKKTRYAITFEYVLIAGLNDTTEDMKRLVKLLKGVRSKVNLIAFNPFPGSQYKGPKLEKVLEFHKYLADRGIQTNIRLSRGQEILAACGQLAA